MKLTQYLTARERKKSIKRKISIDEVYSIVLKHFPHVTDEMVREYTRKREILIVRQVAFYFCYIFTKHSHEEVAKYIGKYDRTTVIHACTLITNLLSSDKEFTNDTLIPLENKLLEKIGIVSYVRQEFIDQLVYIEDEQLPRIRRMTLDYIDQAKICELDEYLMQYKLSVGAAKLYHSFLSISDFAKGLDSAYEQHLFSVFALEYCFTDNAREITSTALGEHLLQGSELIAIYRAYLHELPELYYTNKTTLTNT